MPEAARAVLSAERGIDLYYDWQRMRDQALAVLVNGAVASFRPYDWDSAALAERVSHVEPAGVIVDWLARWEAAETLYFSTVRPPGSFDLAVDGSQA